MKPRDPADLAAAGELPPHPADVPSDPMLDPAAEKEERERAERLQRIAAMGFVRPGAAWLREPPPPRRYLLERQDGAGLLAQGIVGVLGAAGGTGKTFLLTALALAIATGSPWLGRFPLGRRGPGRVVLILGEEAAEEVRRRLHAQARALELGHADLEGRILVLPAAGVSTLALTQPEVGGGAVATTFADDLYAYLEAESGDGWDAVLLDPLSHFAGPDVETDNAAATRLLQVLTRFCSLPGTPTVLVAHHMRKGGKDDGPRGVEAIRGSSAITDNARWAAVLENESDTGAAFSRLRIVKSNYAPPSEEKGVLLARVEGGALRVATATEDAMLAAKGKDRDRIAEKAESDRMKAAAKLEKDRIAIQERLKEDMIKADTKLRKALIAAGNDPEKQDKARKMHAADRLAAERRAEETTRPSAIYNASVKASDLRTAAERRNRAGLAPGERSC